MLHANDVRAALLAVNQPDEPFTVHPGRPDEAEFIVEWRLVDARWQHLLGEARLTRVLMRLDLARAEVRSLDQDGTVTWHAGLPRMTLAANGFQGQQWSREAAILYGHDRRGRLIRRYGYAFSTRRLKVPLRRAVLGCGWTWRAMVSGPL